MTNPNLTRALARDAALCAEPIVGQVHEPKPYGASKFEIAGNTADERCRVMAVFYNLADARRVWHRWNCFEKLFQAAEDALVAFEGEEDSVKAEHAETIAALAAAVDQARDEP